MALFHRVRLYAPVAFLYQLRGLNLNRRFGNLPVGKLLDMSRFATVTTRNVAALPAARADFGSGAGFQR